MADEHQYDVFDGEPVHRDDCRACLAKCSWYCSVIKHDGSEECFGPFSQEFSAELAATPLIITDSIVAYHVFPKIEGRTN